MIGTSTTLSHLYFVAAVVSRNDDAASTLRRMPAACSCRNARRALGVDIDIASFIMENYSAQPSLYVGETTDHDQSSQISTRFAARGRFRALRRARDESGLPLRGGFIMTVARMKHLRNAEWRACRSSRATCASTLLNITATANSDLNIIVTGIEISL